MPCLDGANRVFQAAYDKARASSELEAPLLVALEAELALHVNGKRRAFSYSHPPFHTAKVVAHIAVALYSLTGESKGSELRAEAALRIERIRQHVQSTLEPLESPSGNAGGELERELVPLLKASLEYAARALAARRAPAPGRAEFASATGPMILRITEIATRGQIAALHEAFERASNELSAAERAAMQVVVVGDHQARSRSLGMQYFQRRFGEAEGADDRVTYGENVADEQEAIALVGTRRLDFAIARAFFADEKRLQRDVLGDAAKRCLDRMQLAPIDGAEAGAAGR